MPEARRTLVKSPPELWAEVSDPDSLAKHLEPFGEIRITRVEPETTVAWEGDRACGTVELAATGWGTKVRLTADPVVDEEEAGPPEEPEVVAVEPVAEEPVAEEPVAEEPVVEEPPKRRGFFARLFARREELRVSTDAAEVRLEPEPVVVEPEPEPVVVEEPVAQEPIRVARIADEEAEAVLGGVLDALGSAHHRPFSRG